MIALQQEAVARQLHGDGAEALADAHGADVPRRGSRHAAPVDATVMEKALVLGRDECLAYVFGDLVERDVDSANDREMSDDAAVHVQHAAALARPIRADFSARRASGEPTCEQPAVEQRHTRDREGECRDLPPLAPHPDARGLRRWCPELLAQDVNSLFGTQHEVSWALGF